MLIARAPAKVNLTLHVLGRRAADGYHELESLVAFTGAGDVLSLEPGPSLSLGVDGPTAQAAGEGGDNLVLRAARALSERAPKLLLGAFRSDETSAGRRRRRRRFFRRRRGAALAGASERAPWGRSPSARSRAGDGRGCDRLSRAAGPHDVWRRRDGWRPARTDSSPRGARQSARRRRDRASVPAARIAARRARGRRAAPRRGRNADREALWRLLGKCRNDLEPAALAEAPVIRDVLALLGAARGCKLARMSGSGATCFGLFTSPRAAARAATRSTPLTRNGG